MIVCPLGLMFWHILWTLVDLLFDDLTTPSPFIHEFGLDIQAIKLYKILWHASCKVISCGVGGHDFFGLNWISFDIEHAIFFNCKQLLIPSPVNIALIALRRILSFAEKTYSVVRCVLITWFTEANFVFESILNFFFYITAMKYSGIIIRHLVIKPPPLS